jgi:hypothetical protein
VKNWLEPVRRALRAAPVRPNRCRPAVEELQRRDVPAVLMPASLSGYVYCDANDNGVFDKGESPIAGVTITLTGTDQTTTPVTMTTTTGSNGLYSFQGLKPGTYTITETQPAGATDGKDTQGTPGNGTVGNDVFANISLGSGFNGTNNNFGEHCQPATPPGCLTGVVYVDCNKNGKLDTGESGIAGVTVTLTGPSGTRTAKTDASGRYSFSDLIAGTYTITESQPVGYMQGTNTPGTPTNGTVNGDVISGVVVSGNSLIGYNFGETTTNCGCDTGKGSHGKGSGGKGSHGKGSHAMCDNGSHAKGSHGKGSGGKGSHAMCSNGSHSKGSHGKGSGGKGSQGKGSHGVCDNGSHSNGSHSNGSHDVCRKPVTSHC